MKYDIETINNILQYLMSLSLKQTNEQIQYGIEISIAKIRELKESEKFYKKFYKNIVDK